MDILYFFRERTRFIWYFYKNSAVAFDETKRKIDSEEEPFDNPPYSEDGEPPYLEEWIEADNALEVLGRTCITMLSVTLNLYFETWEKEFGIPWDKDKRKHAFKKGYLNGYRAYFEHISGRSWDDCPADLGLLEQMILARNRDQHPEDITSMHVRYVDKDITRFPSPFFMRDDERQLLEELSLGGSYWIKPAVYASSEEVRAAITEAGKLVNWIEEHA